MLDFSTPLRNWVFRNPGRCILTQNSIFGPFTGSQQSFPFVVKSADLVPLRWKGLGILKSFFTEQLYQSICRGLFEKDGKLSGTLNAIRLHFHLLGYATQTMPHGFGRWVVAPVSIWHVWKIDVSSTIVLIYTIPLCKIQWNQPWRCTRTRLCSPLPFAPVFFEALSGFVLCQLSTINLWE